MKKELFSRALDIDAFEARLEKVKYRGATERKKIVSVHEDGAVEEVISTDES